MLSDDDIENFARQYVEDEGHVEYDIVSRIHTSDTNEWVVEVKVRNRKIILHIDGIDGRLLLKRSTPCI